MIIQKYYNDFQTFIFTNKLLAASSGFVFGMVSKDYIDKFLKEILFPLIMSIFSFNHLKDKIEKKYPTLYLLFKFIWITIVWILSIFFSFFILEYILYRNVLGLSSVIHNEDDKNQYIDMKVKAKTSGIVPDEKELTEIEKEEKIIEKKIKEQYIGYEEFVSKY